ncbi:MAG: hypothetical protein K9F93_03720 [Candidatus Nanopelagicales bacterium]|nr:hypothetical protein [Candidatus Nanopelagicales bacterium]
MKTSIRRIWSTSSAVAVLVSTSVAPAFAESTKRDDGDQPGEPMGTLNAILWFVVLPLAISGLIALLTMGPSWTSAARKSTKGGFLDDPTLSDRQVEADAAKREISY